MLLFGIAAMADGTKMGKDPTLGPSRREEFRPRTPRALRAEGCSACPPHPDARYQLFPNSSRPLLGALPTSVAEKALPLPLVFSTSSPGQGDFRTFARRTILHCE